MKKILFVLSTLVLSLTACADWQNRVDNVQLPLQAETFINKYFSADAVIRVELDIEHLHREYDVYLNDGTKIEFDQQGNFLSIDCQTREVPAGIVPDMIMQYIQVHYAQFIVNEYHVETRHLVVELNNDIELIFDLEGNFIRVDDWELKTENWK